MDPMNWSFFRAARHPYCSLCRNGWAEPYWIVSGSSKPGDALGGAIGSIKIERDGTGCINGCIGIVIFSGSLPVTLVAGQSFNPVFLTAALAARAGLLSLTLFLAFARTDQRGRSSLCSQACSNVSQEFWLIVFPEGVGFHASSCTSQATHEANPS